MSGPEPEVIAGRFELLGPLARGNMGEVYRARDLADGDTVAVKLMRRRRSGEQVSLTEADKNAARFAREVRIMRRLSSENLPRTIDGGLDGDLPYLAMEYIAGDTLDTLLAEADDGLLPVAWAAAIGAQIATGPGRGAPGRRGAPGPQAVQRDARRRRRGEGPGLRRRPDPRRRGRRSRDQFRRDRRYRQVHGTRAGPPAHGDRRRRPVRPRLRAVRDARRRAAVRRRHPCTRC